MHYLSMILINKHVIVYRDWSEFLTSATNSIIQCLHEAEEDAENLHKHKITKY